MESAKNEKIVLITNAEVVGVDGAEGRFQVKVKRHPWFVDIEKCNGCGACVDVCPVSVPHEWDMDLKPRKAIYAMFAQAAPLKYLVDREACVDCGLCMQACGLNAIDLGQEAWEEDLEVGSIIVATGMRSFDPRGMKQFRYDEQPNVVTNMEFERICNAAGPTQGELIRPDGKHIRSVALIQCVGSRDLENHPYCSFFCCMASIKGGRLVMEHEPEAEVTVFFNDMKACGKGFEELYRRSIDDGMRFIQAIPAVYENKVNGNSVLAYEDSEAGGITRVEVDLVVLACGLEPSDGTERLSQLLGIERDPYGFVQETHPVMGMAETSRRGIFMAGTCQGPKDIPDSVTQGSASAALVGILFSRDLTEEADEEKEDMTDG
ncbi:MAG: 4Fe-4S binding protein [Candidatus Geothermincolia bacterium]